MKKLFVVLEQGNECNTKLSIKHKNQFTTEYSDWFRLNWKANKNDKAASFYKDKIVWSEGRSLLFDKVKGKYEYYIFIAHDVEFTLRSDDDNNSNNINSVSEELKGFFTEYNPLLGTIFCTNRGWGDPAKNQIKENYKEVFPITLHDLSCHFFQEDFANCVFPTYFHGAAGSMWYAQFIAYKLYPMKCMTFNKITIENTRRSVQKSQVLGAGVLIKKFSELIKDNKNKKEFISWQQKRPGGYIPTYMNKLDKTKIVFNKEKLNEILISHKIP